MAPPAKSPLDDINSPYYLHPSDGPSLSLVSQPLKEDNYPSWYRAMTIALQVKNKLGFVTGKIKIPGEEDQNQYNAWQRNNGMLISWLFNSVSPEIQPSIMFTDSAQEIWTDLKTRYAQSNRPRKFQIRRELATLTQGTLSVTTYFTKLKSLWDELSAFRPICMCATCTCGGVDKMVEHFNEEYVLAFLMGLNESFANARGQILLMEPLPSISTVFSFVAQEEKQRTITPLPTETGSFVFANKIDTDQTTSSHQAKNQNYQSFNTQKRRFDRPFCTYCKIPGHTIEKCFKVHGYPPGFKKKQPQNNFNQNPGKYTVNQFTNQNSPLDLKPTSSSDPAGNLTESQCQQVLSYLTQKMGNKDYSNNSEAHTAHISCVAGQVLEDDWQG